MRHIKNRLIQHLIPAIGILLFISGCQEIEQPKTVLSPEQKKRVGSEILKSEPTLKYPIHAIFGGKIELLGLNIEGPLEAGKEVTFVWYWKSIKPISKNWTAFVHLDSNSGKFRQNLDHMPMQSMYPTSEWKPGEIIRDTQKVRIQPNIPNGQAALFMGLYRGSVRLPISNAVPKTQEAAPRVIGPTINIKSQKLPTQKPSYLLKRFNESQQDLMNIDGKLNESIWTAIQPLRLQPLGNALNQPTTIKVFLDNKNMYIGATLIDANIWGNLRNRDDETWKEEVLEMFLDFDGDGKDYLELQITPLNTIFDANFKDTLQGNNRTKKIADAKTFNLTGLESSVFVDGSLNNAELDKEWSVEIKIPLSSIPGYSATVIEDGAQWAINFYRFDRPEAGKTYAYAWSTEPAGNFHQVSKFGRFHVNIKKTTAPTAPTAPIIPKMINLPKKLKLNIDPNAKKTVGIPSHK